MVVEGKEEVCDLKEATKKRENQEVESGKIKEKGLEKDEQKRETIEPTKNVPHEVIQEKEIKEDKYDQELDQIKTFSRPKQVKEQDQDVMEKEEIARERESDIEEEGKEKEIGLVKDQEVAHRGEHVGREDKRSKLCVSIIAGSAFLVSIIVLVIQLITTQNA